MLARTATAEDGLAREVISETREEAIDSEEADV
jgi:hypothetical protein